jgi:hypothetical protein
MAATAARPDEVTLEGDDALVWYEPAPGVFYGFCRCCGSTLFWRADAHPEKLSITAGTLDQPTGLRTTEAWWVAEAADYHDRQAGLSEHDRDG